MFGRWKTRKRLSPTWGPSWSSRWTLAHGLPHDLLKARWVRHMRRGRNIGLPSSCYLFPSAARLGSHRPRSQHYTIPGWMEMYKSALPESPLEGPVAGSMFPQHLQILSLPPPQHLTSNLCHLIVIPRDSANLITLQTPEATCSAPFCCDTKRTQTDSMSWPQLLATNKWQLFLLWVRSMWCTTI